ncbi:MAG: nicotinate-nicotinamide nucleotide adenylyltransferase, partial [Gemmatimonadota bacterium]|nr:nicotinate-nicotinamide nucleotide adenylyltransferase [Gemmatimonadota bacterium]
KEGRQAAPPGHRLAMVHLAVDGDPRFSVAPDEIDREGLSYTVDTLAGFADRFPEAERYFLLGADAFAGLGQWRQPERIARLARLAVLQRRGDAAAPPPAGVPASAVVRLHTRRVDVSSTEIRERVGAGRPIRGFVSDAVADYIAAVGLYRQGKA